MFNMSYKVRQMTHNDFTNVLNLASQLNWGFGKFEDVVMMEVDRDGIFVAEDNETGNVMSIIS
jgi:hypothetical protein